MCSIQNFDLRYCIRPNSYLQPIVWRVAQIVSFAVHCVERDKIADFKVKGKAKVLWQAADVSIVVEMAADVLLAG